MHVSVEAHDEEPGLNAVYVKLDEFRIIERTEQVAHGRVNLDWAEDGTLIGVEVLGS